ncbi:MAG: dephospho-CoA kinase [Rhodocyclaceae bacterium]|nr:dephospho-CoA kinase [Rhodocyclaceae bacterium]
MKAPRRGFIVGLTGGIGSGKSEAARCFAALGAAVVDTDLIAHALTAAGGAAIEPIRAAFGPLVLTPDGALDRAVMRQRVFADPRERARLESILHPLIRAACAEEIRRLQETRRGAPRVSWPLEGKSPRSGDSGVGSIEANADCPYVVLVVPLLAESGGYREWVDRVASVDCPEETQIERTMARSALSRGAVEAIMAAQATRQERLAVADDVISNDAELDHMRAQVASLDSRYRQLARREAGSEENRLA